MVKILLTCAQGDGLGKIRLFPEKAQDRTETVAVQINQFFDINAV